MPDLRAPALLIAWTNWLTVRAAFAHHPGRHTGRNLKAATHA
ncbi:hypothetical protein [Actinomadura sp. CNU-125]|nr:hypothetical protein [Actinomadura sp. CNU-125]